MWKILYWFPASYLPGSQCWEIIVDERYKNNKTKLFFLLFLLTAVIIANVWGYFPTYHAVLQMLVAGCPAIEFNCDTINSEIASDPQVETQVQQDCLPLQIAIISRLSSVLFDYWGFSQCRLQRSVLLGWLTELGETLCLFFIISGILKYTNERSDKGLNRARSGMVQRLGFGMQQLPSTWICSCSLTWKLIWTLSF